MELGLNQQFSRTMPGEVSTRWLKNLVDQEAELLRTGAANLLTHEDQKRAIANSTKEYLWELKEEFTNCVELFNAYRGGANIANAAKIFNVANSSGDFILFRNTLKLVISNPAVGVINMSFISRDRLPMTSKDTQKRSGYDLIAQVFPFNDLAWTYHGERVQIKAVVRYMFTEFVRASAVF